MTRSIRFQQMRFSEDIVLPFSMFSTLQWGFRLMKKIEQLFIPFCLCAVFTFFPSCNSRKVDQKPLPQKIAAEPVSKPAAVAQYPEEQVSFHENNLRLRNLLISAKDDVQRSAVIVECDKARTKFFSGKRFRLKNWVGNIAEIRIENKGAWAFLRIVGNAADFPISYQTHYQPWPSWEENSILTKGTKTFQQVTRMSVGDMVTFSGRIIGSLYYKEEKTIDLESVRSPKIILKFDTITPFVRRK